MANTMENSVHIKNNVIKITSLLSFQTAATKLQNAAALTMNLVDSFLEDADKLI